jgi:transposase-like protein
VLKMKAKYDRPQMVRLICEGLSSYQIAARLHVTPSTVRKATRQLKQQQAGTYKPRGREFYSERLIDLVPKTTKIDDAKSATVKANRRELIKQAIEKRRNALPVADAAIPVVDLPAIHCTEHLAVAEFGSGRVLQTIMDDPTWPGIQILRLSELKTPHLHSSQIGGRWISLRFRNRPAVQSLIDHLNQLMKGFDP